MVAKVVEVARGHQRIAAIIAYVGVHRRVVGYASVLQYECPLACMGKSMHVSVYVSRSCPASAMQAHVHPSSDGLRRSQWWDALRDEVQA